MTISIRDLEEAAAAGWRAPEETMMKGDRRGQGRRVGGGGWLLRAAGGFTGRANSALATGDPGMPLADAVGEVCRWYTVRGLPALVSVAYPIGDPDADPVDRFLAGRGWPVRSGAATVMTAASADVADAAADAAATVRVDLAAEPDEAWLGRYRFRGQPLPPIARRLLLSAPWQRFASAREEGRTIAVGRVAVADGWAGLTAVEVDPAHRRRGLGHAITGALAAAAVQRGAANLYLQVENDNTAARALYRQAGFTDHHGYHYRVAPETPEAQGARKAHGEQEERGRSVRGHASGAAQRTNSSALSMLYSTIRSIGSRSGKSPSSSRSGPAISDRCIARR
jgi:ribosomal protein S18 acetylase RimI-like enzyme